ncbi:ImmA/IrrE family metallo-endopeptidase [Thalassoglobus polymorphus]|uniref:IrrE N-terminal-like domain-containing protein n=1 Tax=Thalassoglobus polymorphus TaxID=2527994 RepID=A0A517QQS8_9PLAN|nr:ImmA/IrrE family metallo-endopeptidase [Thalassoglobus polymorphus]QDT33949.1 hypothetical protein Mal48_32060 [Thalassoglobus polymorphus]
MKPLELEQLADEVRAGHEICDTPVDPFKIAAEEQIKVLPGTYDDCFDGRLEYRKQHDRSGFYLFYAEASPGLRPMGRVRFSIAHELGHFYIPAHREYLLSGFWHGSRAGFVSEKPLERQADQFAAALLMPRHAMNDFAKRHRGGCSLQDLADLANDQFETSVLSTVIRYVQLDFEPCCAVLTENGRVRFSFTSDSMRALRLGWVERGSDVPTGTISKNALAAQQRSAKGCVDSEIWFEGKPPHDLWEEILIFGQSGYAVTFLVAEEDDADEDD